jgi:hypothetical protein
MGWQSYCFICGAPSQDQSDAIGTYAEENNDQLPFGGEGLDGNLYRWLDEVRGMLLTDGSVSPIAPVG